MKGAKVRTLNVPDPTGDPIVGADLCVRPGDEGRWLYLPGLGRSGAMGGMSGPGVLAVECPSDGVVGNVLSDPQQRLVIPDDVFVEAALPEVVIDRLRIGGVTDFGESSRGESLEPVNDVQQSERRGGLPCPPARRSRGVGWFSRDEDDPVDVIRHDDEHVSVY